MIIRKDERKQKNTTVFPKDIKNLYHIMLSHGYIGKKQFNEVNKKYTLYQP